LGVAEKIQRAMALRRDVTYTETDTTLMKNIFEETQTERDAKGVLKEKLNFK
jgi:hypothetical protein